MAKISLTSGIIEVKESSIDLVQDCRNREFIQVTQVAHRYKNNTENFFDEEPEEYDLKIWINKIHIIKFID